MLDDEEVIAFVGNIPSRFRSCNLRSYFAEFVEKDQFICFHFKHRPESTLFSPCSTAHIDKTDAVCCLVKILYSDFVKFKNCYHKRRWKDLHCTELKSECFISLLKNANNGSSFAGCGEKKDNEPFSKNNYSIENLKLMPEFNPPKCMPHGNIGTSTEKFFDMIKVCQLPPFVIGKLKLDFSILRSKKSFTCVEYNYNSENSYREERNKRLIQTNSKKNDFKKLFVRFNDQNSLKDDCSLKKKPSFIENFNEIEIPDKESSVSDGDDDDDVEEWDRHDAINDDASNQDRMKERLFEEELEVVWDKGGSGLVFYTDEYYWRKQQGDFDEQTADDWDIDMSCYYGDISCDKDAQDSLNMRREARLRSGLEDTCLENDPAIGKFEKHTKGIGRKILINYGWQDGKGIGKLNHGISDALGNDGQSPFDKRGIGYYGEKMNLFSNFGKKAKRSQTQKGVTISTVYDDPDDEDPPEKLLRRDELTANKYRK